MEEDMCSNVNPCWASDRKRERERERERVMRVGIK